MADLPSIPRRITVEQTRFKSAVSEFLVQSLGSTMNYILDGFRIPPGSIQPYGGDEGTVPLGWLIADGRAVSRTTYANLFTAIGTRWGIGNGSSTFNVPDLRGAFMRGVDLTTQGQKGADPAHASRTRPVNTTGTVEQVGSYQLGDVKSHNHRVQRSGGGGGQGTQVSFDSDGNPANGTPSEFVGTETRPDNYYVLYIIKY